MHFITKYEYDSGAMRNIVHIIKNYFWAIFLIVFVLFFKSQIKRLFDHVFLNLPITINYKFGNNVS